MELTKNYFQALIETSSDAIVLIDETGSIVYQTPSTERISGYSLADIRAIDGIELIHPDDRIQDQNGFLELVKTPGAVLQRKHRFRHKNGNYIWIEGTYRNLLHDENLKAIVYNYTDVTERVLAELKLKERIKELSTIYNVNSILQDDSQSVEEVFGKIVNLLPGGWQYPDICEARITFNNGEYKTPGYVASPFRQSAAIETVDGRTGTIEVIYTKEISGEDEGPFLREERELLNTLARTIEVYFNKKSNQDALAKSEANLKTIFNTTSISYALLDEQFRLITSNEYFIRGYEEQTGIKLQPGVSFLDLTMPDKSELIGGVLRRVLATSMPVDYETVYTNRGGAKYFSVTVSPVMSNGKPIGLCITGTDITNRRRMEIESQRIAEQLKESVNLLQLFVEHSPAALAMFDTNMNYIQVSRRWITDYNLGGVELIGKSHYDIFPTIPQEWKDIHQRCLAGAIESSDEDSFEREDRGLEWLRWEIHPWRKASGEIGGIIMLTEVITERKEADLKFRNLVEKSLVGVYILQAGKFAYVNPRIVEESGYSAEELTGMPVEQFVFKEDLEVMYSNIQARLAGKMDAVRYELRARMKNGQVLWLEMFGTSTLYNGAEAIIGTMVNVTEKKAVYNELEKSEANLKSIFDNTEVSYLLLDVHYDIMAFNQHYLKTYASVSGYELKAGRNYLDLVAPERRENAKKILDLVASNAAPVEYETSFTNPDKILYFNITVSAVFSGGMIIGFCVAAYDITNRKNMEIERQKIVADIINRNRDLQEFAQIVSHNLRGPLSTILGLTNMLKEGLAGEEKDFIMEGIGTSAEKLDSVVRELNAILNLKNASGEASVTVRLDEIMDEVKEKCAELILKSEAEIHCDFHAADELFTMRSFIYNIFYNLVSNSLRFRQKNRPPVISISSERNGGDVVLRITDNGVGIDLEKYGSQVFLLNKTFHNSAEGKGLGLFLVKAQVDVLKGNVGIESDPGVGTTVRISLPL